MKKIFSASLLRCMLLLLWSAPLFSFAKESVADSLTEAEAITQVIDSLNKFDKTIPYKEGKVDIGDMLTLNVPKGYKFVPEKEAKAIVTDLWGNPADSSIIGMIVPAAYKVTDFDSWTFIVSYEETGYVKDEDAEDIDYDEMLKSIQASEPESNKQRVAQGYPNMYMRGWAAKPFYDKERKILHWAKKLQFGDESIAPDELTLNYDVRVLGRKGVLSMNAVGTMSQLNTINQHIPDVLSIATFKDGYAYSDFNPSVDKVAAYTVGGLIAGKLLAKAGIFVLLLKNIKLVIFAIIATLGAFRGKIARLFSRKRKTEEPKSTPEMQDPSAEALATTPVNDLNPNSPEQRDNPEEKI
jgi:uncharacterized membrane-anchored protein